MRRDSAPLGFILLLLVCPYACGDGEYELVWYTIDAGGVTFASGGDYSLGGTIGQADTQTHVGGDYELRKGFWVGACEECDCDDGDVCTCDRCEDGCCANAPGPYGDVICDGTVNVFDILCQIGLVQGGGTSDDPECCFSNADIEPCAGNGVISVLDMLAVLDVICCKIDPCCGTNVCCVGTTCSLASESDCTASGGTFLEGVTSCTPNPCTGPSPAAARSLDLVGGQSVERGPAPVEIKLVPSVREAQPGETVKVDVFATGAARVRGYEIKGAVSGLRRGSASLVPSIQERGDGLMNGAESASAIDQAGGRLVVIVLDGSASAQGRTGYLGTFTVQLSDDAVGTLQVGLATGPDELIVAGPGGEPYDVRVTTSTVRVAGAAAHR